MSRVRTIPISILLHRFTLHARQNVPLLLVNKRRDQACVIERHVLRSELDRRRTGNVGKCLGIGPFRWNTYLASVRLASGLVLPEVFELGIQYVAIGTLGVHTPRKTGQIGRVLCPARRACHHVHHSKSVAHARARECQAIKRPQASHCTEWVVRIHGKTVECALEGHARKDGHVQQPCWPEKHRDLHSGN